MVFIVGTPVGPCGGTRLPHSDEGTLRAERIVRMSCGSRIGIICIASPCGRFIRSKRESADFMVRNRPNDTDDTKASTRDTPTIQRITTMSAAGVLDVAYVAEIAAVT